MWKIMIFPMRHLWLVNLCMRWSIRFQALKWQGYQNVSKDILLTRPKHEKIPNRFAIYV